MLSAMAQTNVELKARDANPEVTMARCLNLGAVSAGTLHQRDVYFPGRHGRLKLRTQEEGGSELIAYRRPDSADARESTYVRAPTSESVLEALEVSLGTTVAVSKRRRLLMWEGVRIHLDDVEGLGSFIEFEAVLPDAGDLASARAKVARLRAELAIEDGALVSVGYSDLLLEGPQALLRAADAAMRNAYAPYSRFPVGAAVRGASGAIYAGANVENVAYPQGQCAEASALGALVTAGETAITAVAVVAEKLDLCPPCGGCRQRLSEFGDASTPVHLGPTTTTLGELLPGAFERGALA
jgi:homotetrameric cytidine deaminase